MTQPIKTNSDLHSFVKKFCETHVTALNGVMDKLPESLKAQMATLKDTLNEQLKALGPIDQVPATQDTA